MDTKKDALNGMFTISGLKRVNRSEAITIGQRYYWTGKPCKQGHLSWRHISGGCRACQKDKLSKRLREERGQRPLMMQIDDAVEDKRLKKELDSLEMI
jgi:hypothetical protein